MSRERKIAQHTVVELGYIFEASCGLIANFTEYFPDPTKLPEGYSANEHEIDNGVLNVRKASRHGRSYKQVIVSSGQIEYIRKRRFGDEKRYINTVYAVEKAEEFMERLAPIKPGPQD